VGHPFSEKKRAEKNQTRMPKRKKTAARRTKLLVFLPCQEDQTGTHKS
jgi:hypothetical protein